jgi:hypothetical protein
MRQASGTCPLTTGQVIDGYFIENRTRLLEIASFLDRLDRSSDGANPTSDFRMEALQHAIGVLASQTPDRVHQIQMILSDPTTAPLPVLDQKSASGAWNPRREVL